MGGVYVRGARLLSRSGLTGRRYRATHGIERRWTRPENEPSHRATLAERPRLCHAAALAWNCGAFGREHDPDGREAGA